MHQWKKKCVERAVVPMLKPFSKVGAKQYWLVALLHAVGVTSLRFYVFLRLLGAVLAAFLFSKVRPTDFGVPMSAANLQEQLCLARIACDVLSRRIVYNFLNMFVTISTTYICTSSRWMTEACLGTVWGWERVYRLCLLWASLRQMCLSHLPHFLQWEVFPFAALASLRLSEFLGVFMLVFTVSCNIMAGEVVGSCGRAFHVAAGVSFSLA